MKVCKRCERDLPLDKFWNLKRAKDGKDNICAQCRSEERRGRQKAKDEAALAVVVDTSELDAAIEKVAQKVEAANAAAFARIKMRNAKLREHSVEPAVQAPEQDTAEIIRLMSKMDDLHGGNLKRQQDIIKLGCSNVMFSKVISALNMENARQYREIRALKKATLFQRIFKKWGTSV